MTLYKTIPLTRGMVAIVDCGDHEELSQYKWQAVCPNGLWYASRSFGSRGARRGERMHRRIMGEPCGPVDHINADGLDNRRCNLRVSTQGQNLGNQRKTRGSSRYKGVCLHRASSLWIASIGMQGKQRHLGYFRDEINAALAYDLAAISQWGAFARPNFLSPVGGATC